MVFSSIPFLYYFLPATLISYFVISWVVYGIVSFFCKDKELADRACLFTKNVVLLCFSLLFYAWGEPKYFFLMAGSVLTFWGCGLGIGYAKTKLQKRIWLWVSVVAGIMLLTVFKYANFFVENVNALTGLNITLLKLTLPVGISFYTFQCMSYTIDVYRGNAQMQRNPITFGAYVSMFPQLIAGPIVRYVDVARELNNRKHVWSDMALGLRRLIIGIGKKILIADNLALLYDKAFVNAQQSSVLFYWMYALAFMLYIYFDFSAYSDMAIGMGRIMGFKFIENFNFPYMSKSVAEFWRRWHMSLGTWFRDYVYIPLGGNRVSKGRWVFNTMVVWMLTGFWHGASWNFVLWGLLYGVCLIIEKWVPALQKLPTVVRHFYTLMIVMLGFVLFNADSLAMKTGVDTMTQVIVDFKSLFGFAGLPLVTAETLYYLRSFTPLLIAAIIGCTPLMKNTANRLSANPKTSTVMSVLEPMFMILVLLVCTGYLVDGAFSAFLYFRF